MPLTDTNELLGGSDVAPARRGRRNVGQRGTGCRRSPSCSRCGRTSRCSRPGTGTRPREYSAPASTSVSSMIDRRRHLHETAVAEASAVRKRALPVRVTARSRLMRQLRRRQVLEAAARRCAAAIRCRTHGVGCEHRREARRRGLHLRLKAIVDRQHACGSSKSSVNSVCVVRLISIGNLIPERVALELARPARTRRRTADRAGRRGRRRGP